MKGTCIQSTASSQLNLWDTELLVSNNEINNEINNEMSPLRFVRFYLKTQKLWRYFCASILSPVNNLQEQMLYFEKKSLICANKIHFCVQEMNFSVGYYPSTHTITAPVAQITHLLCVCKNSDWLENNYSYRKK